MLINCADLDEAIEIAAKHPAAGYGTIEMQAGLRATAGAWVTFEQIYRQEWGQVVATLIRLTGDWELAEECAQEAFAAALQRWPQDGVPRQARCLADHHRT